MMLPSIIKLIPRQRQARLFRWSLLYWGCCTSRWTAPHPYPGRQIGVLFAHGLATTSTRRHPKIAVIGGGASGIFASIAAATATTAENGTHNGTEQLPPSPQVTVLEATSKTLAKVKISGGGRCNVLHDTSKPTTELLQGYPRGRRELNGPYHKGFSPTDAQAWFQDHGVQLKTEADGRMFPVTDSSQTVMDALLGAARRANVQLKLRAKVQEIKVDHVEDENDGTLLHVTWTEKLPNGSRETKTATFDSVVLATGSVPLGYQLALQLGHTIVPTVPSLFTLNAKQELQPDGGGRFVDLAGISVPWARVSLKIPGQSAKRKQQQIQQEGPLLITHHGLSGPAALRLSAFGARAWHDLGYQGPVTIHWAPHCGNTDDIFEGLWKMTNLRPQKTIASACPLAGVDKEGSSAAIPRRLWASQCRAAGVASDQVWGQVSKKIVRKLAMQVSECVVNVTGKGTFKEEFVTAGGVSLKEINMKTMQSKVCPGLFLCGELLDVDGVTGGYNFMNCWSTGYLAGTNAALRAQESQTQQQAMQ